MRERDSLALVCQEIERFLLSEREYPMRNVVLLTAMAGLASVAAAQSGSLMSTHAALPQVGAGVNSGSFSIVASTATVDWTVDGNFTIDLYGDANFGTHIAGGTVSIGATQSPGFVQGMSGASVAWAAGGETDHGYDGNGGYAGLVFGQIIIPDFNLNPDPDSALANGPVLLASFQVQITSGVGQVDWTTAAFGDNFGLEIYDEDSGEFTRLFDGDMNYGSASVQVVPAPSSLALLGLGGLVAGRRRR